MLSKNSRRKKFKFYFEVCFSFHGHRRAPQLVTINLMNNITKSFQNSKKWKNKYNQKPVENEYDIKATLKCIWCGWNAKGFSEMGLSALHNWNVSCSSFFFALLRNHSVSLLWPCAPCLNCLCSLFTLLR